MTRICFVSTRRGNHFMTELLEGVASVLREEGVPVDHAFDRFPEPDGPTAYVFIPHEFFKWVPEEAWPVADQLRRTVSFCVEMPGTGSFELTAKYARSTGGAVAFNRSTATELARRGTAATFFRLGYAPSWDHWHGDVDRKRATDVVYMGSTDSRRDTLLAQYADLLWRYHTRLLIPYTNPLSEGRPDYLMGDEKYGLLADSRLLINLHRGPSRSLEWARLLEAMINGCVVISEHSLDIEPLRAGTHFFSAAPESIGLLADHLLHDPERLSQVRQAAYQFVRHELSMAPAARMLADLAEDLVTHPRPARRAPQKVGSSDGSGGGGPGTANPATTAPGVSFPPPPSPCRLTTAVDQLRRDAWSLAARVGTEGEAGGDQTNDDALRAVCSTPSFAEAAPRVSVIVRVHNEEHHIETALSALAGSTYGEFELLICDDASFDRSSEAALKFLQHRPWLPAALLHSEVGEGRARIRNKLARRSRGEFLFVLEADAGIYRPTIKRLVEALDGAPAAAFAYPILAVGSRGAATGLISNASWDPWLLRRVNYIGAISLIRRATFLALGGLGEDPRLGSRADYDLWCRFAAAGHTGAFLSQILGWQREADRSGAVGGEAGSTEPMVLIRERSPALFNADLGPDRHILGVDP